MLVNNKYTTSTISDEFNNLLNTPRTEGINNLETNRQLKELLAKLESNHLNDLHVTELDIITAVNSLNKGKARDPFELQAEYFIHATND